MTLDELIEALQKVRFSLGRGDLQVEQGGGGGGITDISVESDAAHPEGVMVLRDEQQSAAEDDRGVL